MLFFFFSFVFFFPCLEHIAEIPVSLLAEPDLSNPTRHRYERPLDTIRSFEAAIDGSYNNRRMSYVRRGTLPRAYRAYDRMLMAFDPEESANGGYSRRSSYIGGKHFFRSAPNHRAFLHGLASVVYFVYALVCRG